MKILLIVRIVFYSLKNKNKTWHSSQLKIYVVESSSLPHNQQASEQESLTADILPISDSQGGFTWSWPPIWVLIAGLRCHLALHLNWSGGLDFTKWVRPGHKQFLPNLVGISKGPKTSECSRIVFALNTSEKLQRGRGTGHQGVRDRQQPENEAESRRGRGRSWGGKHPTEPQRPRVQEFLALINHPPWRSKLLIECPILQQLWKPGPARGFSFLPETGLRLSLGENGEVGIPHYVKPPLGPLFHAPPSQSHPLPKNFKIQDAILAIGA